MIKKYLGRIGTKFYKYLFFTAIFSVFFVSGFQIMFGYFNATDAIKTVQEQIVNSISAQVLKNIENVEQAMKLTMISKGLIEKGVTERFGFYLKKLLKQFPSIVEVLAIDLTGKEVVIASRVRLEKEKQDRSKEPFFKESISGKSYRSKVYLRNNKPYMMISMPIVVYGKKILGVLAAEVSLFELQKFILDTKVGKGGYAYVADSEGNVIAHPILSHAIGGLNINNIPNLKGFLGVYSEPDRFHHFIYRNTKGELVFGSATGIKEMGWIIGVSQPVSEVFRHEINTIIFFTIGLIFIIVLIFILARRYASKVAQPIMQLYNATDKIGAGNLGETVYIKTGDEIEELAEKFNLMSAKLKNSYEEMEQKIDERTREVVTLFSFTSAVSKDIELEKILRTAGDELSFMLDMSGYVFYTKSSEKYEIKLFKGIEQTEAQKLFNLLTDEEKKAIFDHNTPVIYNKLETAILCDKGQVGASGFFPIVHIGDILGIFVIFNVKNNCISDSTKYLIDTCMLQLGTAIKNALLFDQTKQLSLTDQLTGLANRRYFEAKMEYEFSRFKRYERPFSLVMLDIDHFKKVNDTYGHQSGDMVLEKLGKIISDFLRKSDFAARYGGEEFAILMPETTKENACFAAERLRKKVEEEVFEINTEPDRIKLTISLGTAEATKDMENWHQLVEMADKALYMAKQSGRNRNYCI